MALPLAPIAVTALRYGGVALVAYAVSRRIGPAPTHQASEDALDRVDEGLGASHAKDRGQANLNARWRRVIRVGKSGPAVEVDATALGRIRIRRVK